MGERYSGISFDVAWRECPDSCFHPASGLRPSADRVVVKIYDYLALQLCHAVKTEPVHVIFDRRLECMVVLNHIGFMRRLQIGLRCSLRKICSCCKRNAARYLLKASSDFNSQNFENR